jgi:hypothetical protein
MKSMLITSWPIHNCEISKSNFDKLFLLNEEPVACSAYVPPFLVKKRGDQAGILLNTNYFQGLSQKTDMAYLPVYIIPDNFSTMKQLEIVTDYYLQNKNLNYLIIANLLQYLDTIHDSEPEKQQYISQKLNISPKPKILEKYKKFTAIDSKLSRYLIQKKAPLKLWEQVTRYSASEQQLLLSIITETVPSLGNFLEIVENLLELAHIYSVMPGEILENLKISELLEQEESQKLPLIREKIMQLRYPNLTDHRKEIEGLFSALPKMNNLNLQYDRSLEKKELRGFFTITGEKDLQRLEIFFSAENRQKILDIITKI